MSHSDKWLLIYGRKKAIFVFASKTALLLFSCNAEISKFSRRGSSLALKFLLNLLKG